MSFLEACRALPRRRASFEAGGAKPGSWVARSGSFQIGHLDGAYDFANERAYDFRPAGRVLWHT
jgi:hypothetical protein